MREIELTKGYVAQVDDQDFPLVSSRKWYALIKQGKPYAAHDTRKDGKRVRTLMHRLIQGVDDPTVLVDHRSGNTLVNTRQNLREATRGGNQRNVTKLSAHNTTGYKGVSRDTKSGKPRAMIIVNNKRIHLGLFEDPRYAAKAYDDAATQYFGEFAYTNKMLGLI